MERNSSIPKLKFHIFSYVFFIALALPALAFADPSLNTDQSNYLDNQSAVFTITGAPPGSKIYWSSEVNEKTTGEGNPAQNQGAYYGQVVGADGTWTGSVPNWNSLPQGFWTKTAYFDDGSQAAINFNVEPHYSNASGTTAHTNASASSKFQTSIGVADWGGVSNSSSMSNLIQSAQDVQTLGAKNIMLALTPSYKNDYPNTNFGSPAPTSLTQLAQTQPFQNVLGMPFQTVSIDIAPFSNNDPTDAAAQNLNQVTSEVRCLAVYLLKKYAGTGKTFILKNWEGDNLLDDSNPSTPVTPDAIQKMIAWLNAINAGVVEARQEMGDTGATVEDAVEFNSLFNARQNKPSMLNDVIPYVKSDLVSYSSYDTINPPATANLETSVENDMEYIKNSPGIDGRPLMIGEWSVPDGFPDQAARIDAIDKAFSEEGISLANYWQMIASPGAGDTYGLIGSDGAQSPAYAAIDSLVNTSDAANTPADMSHRTKILKPSDSQGSNFKEQYVISAQPPNIYSPASVRNLMSTSHPVTYINASAQ